VELSTNKTLAIDYRGRNNPPILHRKETLLPPMTRGSQNSRHSRGRPSSTAYSRSRPRSAPGVTGRSSSPRRDSASRVRVWFH
jgi:hypothetical protein